MDIKTKHRIINGILGILCLLILIHQCMFEYGRWVRLEGIKFIISLVMGILSLAGWSFLTYCFFRIDVYGTLVNMFKARKRLNRMRKN